MLFYSHFGVLYGFIIYFFPSFFCQAQQRLKKAGLRVQSWLGHTNHQVRHWFLSKETGKTTFWQKVRSRGMISFGSPEPWASTCNFLLIWWSELRWVSEPFPSETWEMYGNVINWGRLKLPTRWWLVSCVQVKTDPEIARKISQAVR